MSRSVEIREHELEIQRELASRSLLHTIKFLFNDVNRPAKFADTWVMGCLCEHLMAIRTGEIKRLIVNLPPRTFKSQAASVFLPIWWWASDPTVAFIHMTYDQTLGERDADRRRNFIKSPKYQELFQPNWSLDSNASKKEFFHNTRGGSSLTTTKGGAGSGFDADCAILDDPNKLSSSKIELEEDFAFYGSQIATRGRLLEAYRILIVQQRFSALDISGICIANDLGFETLILPMYYEPSRLYFNTADARAAGESYPIIQNSLQAKSATARDRRHIEGQLLDPVRWKKKDLDDLTKTIALSGGTPEGQLQQRPGSAGGTLFLSEYYREFRVGYHESFDPHELCVILKRPPEEGDRAWPIRQCRCFQTADTALKEKQDSDSTAVGTFFLTPENDLLIYDILCHKIAVLYQSGVLMSLMAGPGVWEVSTRQFVPTGFGWPIPVMVMGIEDKGSGTGLIMEFMAQGLPVVPLKADVDKIRRAAPAAVLYKQGKVYHNRLAGQMSLLEKQLVEFPSGAHDDIVDVVAYAARMLLTDSILKAQIQITPIEKLIPRRDMDKVQLVTKFGRLEIAFDD